VEYLQAIDVMKGVVFTDEMLNCPFKSRVARQVRVDSLHAQIGQETNTTTTVDIGRFDFHTPDASYLQCAA
jgi:hypothetical protein